MSRIGKLPIQIVAGVDITIDGANIKVKGPKGELNFNVPAGVILTQTKEEIIVSIESDMYKNLWGLVRTLISNMIEGVTKGYEKKLLIFGVGYNAKIQGQKLVLNLGLSHIVEFVLPAGIAATAEKDPKGTDIIVLTSIDKQKLGEVAAKIRSLREPEIYKGKGIRYVGEIIKLKPGKTASKK